MTFPANSDFGLSDAWQASPDTSEVLDISEGSRDDASEEVQFHARRVCPTEKATS
jgi:hypothetical protein